MERWYDRSIKETEEKLETNISDGLSRTVAAERLEKNGLNSVFPIPQISFWEYMRKLSTNTVSILLALSCVLAAIFNQVTIALTLIITLIANYILVIATYVAAQKIFASTGRASLPTARVIRSGKITLVRQEHIVEGDIICLSEGDIVPCDARLIEDRDLIVIESGITTAKGPVLKNSSFQTYRNIDPSDALCMVYASTIVKSGYGKAIACRTGKNCYVCSIGKNKSATSHDKLAIFETLKKISFFATLTAILLTFVLTFINMTPAFSHFDALYGLIYALTYGCAAMTEFYAVFGYVIVAVGIFSALDRSEKISQGALIKNSEKLLEMSQLTTLIIPSEAVTSMQDMTLDLIYTDSDENTPVDIALTALTPTQTELIRYAVVSTGLYGHRLTSLNASGNNVFTCEEEAIIKSAKACGLYNRELHERFPLREHMPKGQLSPFEITLIRNETENRIIARGSADAVIGKCSYYRDRHGGICRLDARMRSHFLTLATQMMRERGTVRAIASCDSMYYSLVRLSDTLKDMIFEGLLGFNEPLLADAVHTVTKCEQANIKIVLFCSDISERNLQLARMIGILKNDQTQAITGSQIAAMSDTAFLSEIQNFTVFQGLSVKSEKAIISRLRAKGEKVGFLGRDFDEITAMREANVSYTQSITLSDHPKPTKSNNTNTPTNAGKSGDNASGGCDALRFVCDVILSPVSKYNNKGGLNALCRSIEHAKMIYRGIHRMLSYLITVNTARLILLAATLVSGTIYLTPVQILLCGLALDLFAVLIIAFEKPDREILSEPIKRRSDKLFAFLDGILLGVCCMFAGMVLTWMKITSETTVCTAIFATLCMSMPVILIESGRYSSLLKGEVKVSKMFLTAILVIIATFAVGLILPKFGILFGIYRIPATSYIASAVVTVILLFFNESCKLSKK